MTDITTLNYPTEAERENLLLYAWDRNTPGAQFRIKIEDLGGVSGGSSGVAVQTWDFNFAGAGAQYIRAQSVMTITQRGTSGAGTVAYEKSTAAAPDTFAAATSPITLEAGAKLKVTASDVTATFAVHLERTA